MVSNKISTKTEKQIKEWSENNHYIFSNSNFITGLSNIILNTTFEKYYFELKMIELFDSTTVVDHVKQIINTAYGNEEITILVMDFYLSVVNYKIEGKKDFDKEYDLSLMYSKLVNYLKNNLIKDFNKLIMYLNKNIYYDQKGFLNE